MDDERQILHRFKWVLTYPGTHRYFLGVLIRADGCASIGGRTKTIQEWLEYKLHREDCIGRAEFDRMQSGLRPIFTAYPNISNEMIEEVTRHGSKSSSAADVQ